MYLLAENKYNLLQGGGHTEQENANVDGHLSASEFAHRSRSNRIGAALDRQPGEGAAADQAACDKFQRGFSAEPGTLKGQSSPSLGSEHQPRPDMAEAVSPAVSRQLFTDDDQCDPHGMERPFSAQGADSAVGGCAADGSNELRAAASLSQMDAAVFAQLPAELQQQLLCQPLSASVAPGGKQVCMHSKLKLADTVSTAEYTACSTSWAPST